MGPLTQKAKELAHELGAEAVVIVALMPNADGDGWQAEHSAYIDRTAGMSWELLASVVADAAEDILTQPVQQEPEPS